MIFKSMYDRQEKIMLSVNDIRYKLYLSYPDEWDFIKRNVNAKRIDSIIEEKICHFEIEKARNPISFS